MSKELNKAPVEQAELASCQGTNCGTTTGDHSSECLAEAAASQGWELKPGDLCGRDCPMRPDPVEQAGGDERAALAQPSPALPPFAEKVLAKLRRFNECAEDPGSGGVDIGRHWLDLLTQLGLLNRVQRSPALWEISQQGEDLLGTPQPSPVSEALIYACKNLAQITSSDGSGHADIAMAVLRMAGVGDDERERLVNEWKAARAWKPSPAQAEQAEAERPEVVASSAAADIVGDVCDLDPEDDGPDCVRVNVKDLLRICERHIVGVAQELGNHKARADRFLRLLHDEKKRTDKASSTSYAAGVDDAEHGKVGGKWRTRLFDEATNRANDLGYEGVLDALGDLKKTTQRLHEVAATCATAEQERDAALAKLAEMDLKLSTSDYAYDSARSHMRGLAARAIERAKVFDDGSDGADAESARSVVAILRELLAVGTAPVAQAQHSVPELLVRAEGFVSGFEDDDEQEGVSQLLADLRLAIGRAK